MGETALVTVDKPPSYSGFGRPTDLSYELINRIGARILAGAYPLTAARAEGIAERTWLRWTDRGRLEDQAGELSIYAHLWQVIDQKEAENECGLIELATARKVGWQGPMTVASRRYRERWEDKQASNASLQVIIGIPAELVRGLNLSPGETVAVERRSVESLAIDAGSDKASSVNQR